MATAAANDVACKLVQAGNLELKNADFDNGYIGLVVLSQDKIIMVDNKANQVRLHSLQNGRLLAVYSTESIPSDICVCNEDKTQMAVSLWSGRIEILSVEFTNQTTEITRTETLNVRSSFDSCDGVKYLNKTLVVSGKKKDNICWGVVSITDGHVQKVHNICKCGDRGWSSLCTNNNDMVFISCSSGDKISDKNGVYGFRNSRLEFLYQHNDLNRPTGVTMDKRHVYVCNRYPPCIHEMTESGQPLTIHTQGIQPSSELLAIHWNQQDGLLYITSLYSNKITRFRQDYSGHQDPVIHVDVLQMDAISLDMYKKALRGGKEKFYSIMVMVVGHYGVGKTTLTKRLLGKDVNISERKGTEGIDVHIECSKVSLSSGEWTAQEENAEQYLRLQRLVKYLNEHAQKQKASGEQECQSGMDDPSGSKKHENEHRVKTSNSETINQLVQSKTTMIKSNLLPPSQQTQPSIAKMDKRHLEHVGQTRSNISTLSGVVLPSTSETKDIVIEILQLVNKNSDKLKKNLEEYAALAMWDFAGRYVFYTTHHTFLTSRAVYLLVIDLSQQVTDLVEDECFLDIEGMKQCKVHDLIDIWLNFILSCTPSTDSGIPPVILVGTHVDKIPEKSRQKVIDEYYRTVRRMLKDKATILHLKGDIVIDNTKSDTRLDELKRKIVELATQQPHWGKERPARWLPLEQAIMTLKASGVKVAPLSLVEEINRSGSVRIADKGELELFLRFQHEMGTILYFSVEGMREKIVLDPQWLIDALKSLFTAEMYISINPAIIRKWLAFKTDGKLTQELIDAISTKKINPDFHDNKEHILLLMEKLNIISRPRSYGKDGKIKEENYYLAPCMIHQATPKEIISPKANTQNESTSVLCFVSKQKFLPPPVFHRLIGAGLTHWPIAQQKSENLIYCGCCVFDLDDDHRLTLYFREYVIFTRITRMGVTDRSFSSELCIQARKFIFENLSKMIGNVGKSQKVELHVQCPISDAGSLQDLIPVSQLKRNKNVPCPFHKENHTLISWKLLQFWFEEEGILTIPDSRASCQVKGKYYIIFAAKASNQVARHLFKRMYSVPYKPIQYDRHREFSEQEIQSDRNFQSQQTSKVEFLTSTPALHESKQHPRETRNLTPPPSKGHVAEMVQKFDGHQSVIRMTLKDMTRQEGNVAYLHELQRTKSKISQIYEAIDDREGKSNKELTIEKGDILLVLDSNRNWCKVKNYRGEVGQAPYIFLKTVETKSADMKIDSVHTKYARVSDLMTPEKYQMSVQGKALPPGKKYHAFFSYSDSDLQWVKKTVEGLEKDGFICCVLDRDKTPGTQLLAFVDNMIRSAYKSVVIMTRAALQSGFVLHEIQMAIIQGFNEGRNCVVPVLLEDCEVPGYLSVLNYVDARDSKRRDTWWTRLLRELETQGDHKSPDVVGSYERKQPATGETSTETEDNAVKDQEGEVADAPITQEHINHARLCNALATVCSDALRKILLSHIPAPHRDIYQAILANQAKLKRLNKDQHQLVFPDPKHHYTGTVDQFDISLLYTLIRNISSAPPPSNGWGNAPADQPRDTTLGASVERIRLYRNSISGHSVDGKVNQQHFENYWKMIEDVLNDIENAIGKQAYLSELEKRRNQVITPHEAHELRKTFREYRKQVEAEVDDISSSLKNALSKLEGLRGLKK